MGLDLNADVGDIFDALVKKFKNRNDSQPGKEVLNKERHMVTQRRYQVLLGMLAALLIIVVSYIFMSLMPRLEENAHLEKEIANTQQQKNELPNMQSNRVVLNKKIEQNIDEYRQSLSLFDEMGDLDGLYKTISTIASAKRLRITQVKNHEPVEHAVFKELKEARLNVNLQGTFINYLEFKKQLAHQRPILSIKSEKIGSQTPGQGGKSLNITLELSTYMIDKKPFHELISKYSH